jgi:hypothetical protein
MPSPCSAQYAPSGQVSFPVAAQRTVHVPPRQEPATQSESVLHAPPKAPGVGTGYRHSDPFDAFVTETQIMGCGQSAFTEQLSVQ